MPYALGAQSRAELVGVHPSLQAVVERAIAITEQDFKVHDGCRTEAEQREFVKRGVSKTMHSRHLVHASDGLGHAVDLVPWINGAERWEWGPIYRIAAAMRQAAEELGVELIWGGVWDTRLNLIEPGWESMQAAVAHYCTRHPGPDFIDGPHFELAAG